MIDRGEEQNRDSPDDQEALKRELAGRRPLTAPNIDAQPVVTDQLRAFVGKI
jgi:hypothetical protein